jgi:thioester reductase-like protein
MTEAIYHAGAMVNFVYPYEAHKPANVSGTQEILRLASLDKLKPVHFVSTVAVSYNGDSSNGRVFFENDDLVGVGSPLGGYSQSKWVAERMVLTARERGIPVVIYRPGLVTGHSVTGAWNTDDLISTLVLASQAMGALPELDGMVDLVPVDYVSRAIITLSRRPGSLNRIFHLANPRPMAYRDLIAWVNASGDEVEVVPFEEWRGKLIDLVPVLGADAFIPLLEEVTEDQVFMPAVDCSNTLAALRETDVRCSPVNGELLDVYRTFLARQGVEWQEDR